MAKIDTVQALRAVLGPHKPTTPAKILPRIEAQGAEFLRVSPFAVVSTVDAHGVVEASPKGDLPGFIRLENDRTLLMPERAGNNLAFGLQNIVANGRIGIIAFRPGTGETLRITGRAELHDDADLLAMLGGADKPALLAIRVHVERCYFHCARSVLRAGLWDPKTWADAQRVSFGRIIAEGLAQGTDVAAAIDESVQGAYTERLWSNKA
jgi:hypothetical protein